MEPSGTRTKTYCTTCMTQSAQVQRVLRLPFIRTFVSAMLLVVLSLVLCAFTALCLYARRCNNYWKKHDIVSVKSNFFLGNLSDYMKGRRSLEQVYHDIYKASSNEPYVGIIHILKPVLFIRDLEIINKVTVKDFSCFHHRSKESAVTTGGRLDYSVLLLRGEEWRTVRNKLIPTFSGSKMRTMYPLIEGCAQMMMDTHFRPLAEMDKPIEVHEIMTCYTLDVLGCCAFGLQFNTLTDSKSLFRKIANSSSGLWHTVRLMMRILTPNLVRWIGIKLVSDEVENFFFNLLHQAEEVRRKETEHRGDFLQLMIDIRDKEDRKASHLFTDNHIASNMYLFYFAGHETTSNTLSFALYELAINPEIQNKLRDEIRKARESNGGVLNYDTVQNILYLEMVIQETLRLHTPLGYNSRLCTETYQLPGSSYKLRPGDKILYSITGIHYDEKYFPNPEKFDPERFSAENIARRNPNAFQPFGMGPRMCLGERFAKLEMKIGLVHILLQYRLTRCNKTETPVILNPKNFLHSAKNGIWLSIEELSNS